MMKFRTFVQSVQKSKSHDSVRLDMLLSPKNNHDGNQEIEKVASTSSTEKPPKLKISPEVGGLVEKFRQDDLKWVNYGDEDHHDDNCKSLEINDDSLFPGFRLVPQHGAN